MTKTYAPDLARCELLCESVDTHLPAIMHWIVVDARDSDRFAHLEGRHRRLLLTEDILPIRMGRVTFGPRFERRNVWLSLRARPVRGWLVQQLAKFAVARAIEEDVILYVDSDIVFTRAFEPCSLFAQDGRVPLYCVPDALDGSLPHHIDWHRATEALLGLPERPLPLPDFVGPLIYWRRENVLALLEHLEERAGRNWVAALARANTVSEYTVYGRYATEILGETSGHVLTDSGLCHCYWPAEPLDEAGLRDFVGSMAGHHVSVMINPKSRTPVELYAPLAGVEARPGAPDAAPAASSRPS